MILLATNKRDVTTDFVVLELNRRGLPFVRLNAEDATEGLVRFDPDSGWALDLPDRSIRTSDVRAAYYRRPGRPSPEPDPRAPGAASYREAEWTASLKSIWGVLEDRWLNSPSAITRAEDKPRQLSLARSLGMDVPVTLVTNDVKEAMPFVAAGPTVCKPLRQALVEDGGSGRVIFTNRIASLDASDGPALALAPVILQREVAKACDVRATVVGNRVFAAEIHSQAKTETEVDWRRGSDPELRHEAVELPARVATACVAVTKALGLRFGAIDLVRDRDGRHWFLEINPNGQWAWIEKRTGLPISAAIVDVLADWS